MIENNNAEISIIISTAIPKNSFISLSLSSSTTDQSYIKKQYISYSMQ